MTIEQKKKTRSRLRELYGYQMMKEFSKRAKTPDYIIRQWITTSQIKPELERIAIEMIETRERELEHINHVTSKL